MSDREERIRRKAYELWEADGRPEGRHEDHWLQAREIVALEEAGGPPTRPVEVGEAAEPALALASLGDLPGLSDQGDGPAGPQAARTAELADARPSSHTAKPKGTNRKASESDGSSPPRRRRSAAGAEGPAQPDPISPSRGRKRSPSPAPVDR